MRLLFCTLPASSVVSLALTVMFSGPVVLAQDRPSEDDIFGASPATPATESSEDSSKSQGKSSNSQNKESPSRSQDSASTPSTKDEAEKAGILGVIQDDPSSPEGAALMQSLTEGSMEGFGGLGLSSPSEETAPDDPLRLGGQLYTRLLGSMTESSRVGEMTLSNPSLVDVYLDARPNDRVRGMVVGRLTYNPIATTYLVPGLTYGSTTESQTNAILNQLWLRFDLARSVFVTVGKQHVKWGTGRFWNPTDYLQAAIKDPLEPFDVRTGVPMVKFHVPWESNGWNFYGIAFLDSLKPEPSLERMGAAFRGEAVFGTVEVGLDTLLQGSRSPRFGVDVSAGLGPFDAYGEVGVRRDSRSVLWRKIPGVESDDLADEYEAWQPGDATANGNPIMQLAADLGGYYPNATLGASISRIINDNDNLTFGVEYNLNPAGYADANDYAWLLFQGDFTPFYLGQHYGAFYALLSGPGRWEDASFTFSTLGNLSDFSFVSRLDFSTLLLTHLRLEAYVGTHYVLRPGAVFDPKAIGEFHLAIESDPTVVDGQSIPALSIPGPRFDVGLSLRINI